MGFFDDLNDEDVLEMARMDFKSAMEARRSMEDRKIRDLQLYRQYRTDVNHDVGPGEGGGPFGWSKVSIPIIYWVVETILPRIGVQPPKPIITPETADAAPYAQAAQLRLDRHLQRAWSEERAITAIKQMLVLGDSPIKVPWDEALCGPTILPIPWFDFYLSPEAMFWDTAEVMYHRTWWTRRSLIELGKRDARRSKPVFNQDALQQCIEDVGNRAQQDTTWAARREAAGLVQSYSYGTNDQQVALVECWYSDGSRALIAGNGIFPSHLLQVVPAEDSTFRDPYGVPFRPFANLANSPDPGFIPFSVSDAEVLEDMQAEHSTMHNQVIDQATANINAPIAYDRNSISAADVQAGYNQPRGTIPTNGPPDQSVKRMDPGNLSGDHDRLMSQAMEFIQRVSGVSDIAAGQFNPDQQTATGMGIIASEGNMRHKMRMKLAQLGFRRVAQYIYYLDRAMGSPVMGCPCPPGFTPDPNQSGVVMQGNLAMVHRGDVYGPGMYYGVDVDAGAMAPPGQSEQAQKTRSFAMDVSANPIIAQQINWRAVAEQLAESAGLDPHRVLVDPTQAPPMGGPPPAPVPGGPPAADPGQGAPPDPGATQPPDGVAFRQDQNGVPVGAYQTGG